MTIMDCVFVQEPTSTCFQTFFFSIVLKSFFHLILEFIDHFLSFYYSVAQMSINYLSPNNKFFISFLNVVLSFGFCFLVFC